LGDENRRRFVVSAAIGAVVGAAAGFYVAARSQTSCSAHWSESSSAEAQT